MGTFQNSNRKLDLLFYKPYDAFDQSQRTNMRSMIYLWPIFFIIAGCSGGNLHLIDKDTTGFAIYRSGYPSAKMMKSYCELGISEMMVLSGNADEYEESLSKECPTLKVIYNKKQEASTPVDSKFLQKFDNWVTKAKKNGKKIIFRCNCGCHRTGRLAAYYQMKYQNLSATDAKIIMRDHGKWMFLFPYLNDQVDDLQNYIKKPRP